MMFAQKKKRLFHHISLWADKNLFIIITVIYLILLVHESNNIAHKFNYVIQKEVKEFNHTFDILLNQKFYNLYLYKYKIEKWLQINKTLNNQTLIGSNIKKTKDLANVVLIDTKFRIIDSTYKYQPNVTLTDTGYLEQTLLNKDEIFVSVPRIGRLSKKLVVPVAITITFDNKIVALIAMGVDLEYLVNSFKIQQNYLTFENILFEDSTGDTTKKITKFKKYDVSEHYLTNFLSKCLFNFSHKIYVLNSSDTLQKSFYTVYDTSNFVYKYIKSVSLLLLMYICTIILASIRNYKINNIHSKSYNLLNSILDDPHNVAAPNNINTNDILKKIGTAVFEIKKTMHLQKQTIGNILSLNRYNEMILNEFYKNHQNYTNLTDNMNIFKQFIELHNISDILLKSYIFLNIRTLTRIQQELDQYILTDRENICVVTSVKQCFNEHMLTIESNDDITLSLYSAAFIDLLALLKDIIITSLNDTLYINFSKQARYAQISISPLPLLNQYSSSYFDKLYKLYSLANVNGVEIIYDNKYACLYVNINYN